MSSYYPEGGMMGSGIYSVEVEYEEFFCEDCEKTNEAGTTATDDWGTYIIECEFCNHTHRESSLSEDRDDYYQD